MLGRVMNHAAIEVPASIKASTYSRLQKIRW